MTDVDNLRGMGQNGYDFSKGGIIYVTHFVNISLKTGLMG